jgi:hypothetical protein
MQKNTYWTTKVETFVVAPVANWNDVMCPDEYKYSHTFLKSIKLWVICKEKKFSKQKQKNNNANI